MERVKSRKGQRDMLVLFCPSTKGSSIQSKLCKNDIKRDFFSRAGCDDAGPLGSLGLIWDPYLRITSVRTVTLFSKSQPSSFSCSLNPKLCHLGLLERGTESSFSVRMQNLSVLSASNGMSAVTMISAGRACTECARCALLCLCDSRVDANTDTYSAFTKSSIYTYSVKYNVILNAISGPPNHGFKGDVDDCLLKS